MHIRNRLPRRVQEGIAFTDTSNFRFYRVKSFPYGSLSKDEKVGAWINRAHLFSTIQSENMVFQLYLMEKNMDWTKFFHEKLDQAHPGTKMAAERLADGWQFLIEENAKPMYEWVVALELPDKRDEVQYQSAFEGIAATHRDLMMWLGFEKRAKDFLTSEIEAAIQAGKELEAPEWILEPMKSWEVYDFYRYHYNRGLEISPIPERMKDEDKWPADNSEYVPDADLDEGEGHAILRKPGRERYIACVVPTLLPPLKKPRDIPISEVVYRVSTELPFAVDFTLHGIFHNNDSSRRFAQEQGNDVLDKLKAVSKVKVEEQEKKLKNHQHQTELPEFDLTQQQRELEIVKRYEEVKAFTNYVHEGDSPTVEAHMMFLVSARNEKQLESRVKQVKDLLQRCDVLAEVPNRDQRALFESWYPARQWEGYGYRKRLIPEYTSLFTMVGASEIIGSSTGFPFALNRFGQPVLVSLLDAILSDRNANWYISGDQGSGKTHLLNMLAVISLMYERARVTMWDMKPEDNRAQWIRNQAEEHGGLPDLGHLVEKFPLDGNRFPGGLDLFHLIDDPAKAKEAAIGMIDAMLPHDNLAFDRKLALYEAAESIDSLTKSASMEELIYELETSAEKVGRDLGKFLKHCANYPLGKLLFGRKTREMKMPDSGIVLIQPEGLEIPENKEPEKLLEHLSIATLNNMAIWNQDYLFDYPGLGVGMIDEGWTILKKYAGRIISDRQSRLGRSKKTALVFASQNAMDIPPDLMSLVGTYVALGTTTPEETDVAMKYLKVHPNNERIRSELEQIATNRPDAGEERQFSQGFMRDIRDRTALVNFITPDEELRRGFKTRPEHAVTAG